NLFGFQALAFQHVLKVHVAANIELVGAVYGDTAGLKECRQGTVGDGCTNLGVDVVSNNGYSGIVEILGPFWVRSDKHLQRVDKSNTGIHGSLGIVLSSLFGTYRQIGDQDVDLISFELLDHITRLGFGFFNGLTVILA